MLAVEQTATLVNCDYDVKRERLLDMKNETEKAFFAEELKKC